MSEEIILSKQTQGLIEDIKKIFPGGVKINEKTEEKRGFVRHDQAQQYLRGGELVVDLYDMTQPDYTVMHELLHFLHMFNGAPQISFNLTTKNKDIDTKFMATALEIYDTVMHDYVYRKQQEMNVMTDEIQELYFKGVLAVLKPEPKERDNWMVLRLLTLLDCLLFFKDEQDNILPKLEELYPQSLKGAKKLYQILADADLSTAFIMRRTVVKLFKAFDQQLEDWGMVPMHLNEFATLSVVLSERQQRLQVKQLFEIVHSPLTENLKFKDAYVGRWKNDGQNSFVIADPGKKAAQTFVDYYEMPVTQFLSQLGIEFMTR